MTERERLHEALRYHGVQIHPGWRSRYTDDDLLQILRIVQASRFCRDPAHLDPGSAV